MAPHGGDDERLRPQFLHRVHAPGEQIEKATHVAAPRGDRDALSGTHAVAQPCADELGTNRGADIGDVRCRQMLFHRRHAG
jgi:hypothetical protein